MVCPKFVVISHQSTCWTVSLFVIVCHCVENSFWENGVAFQCWTTTNQYMVPWNQKYSKVATAFQPCALIAKTIGIRTKETHWLMSIILWAEWWHARHERRSGLHGCTPPFPNLKTLVAKTGMFLFHPLSWYLSFMILNPRILEDNVKEPSNFHCARAFTWGNLRSQMFRLITRTARRNTPKNS